MGMFDYYLPESEFRCRDCGAKLDEWQGKDGPCLLFVWKQGERHPVDQTVDEELKAPPAERMSFVLPDRFEIYTSCAQCDEWAVLSCRCEDSVWNCTASNIELDDSMRSTESICEYRERLKKYGRRT